MLSIPDSLITRICIQLSFVFWMFTVTVTSQSSIDRLVMFSSRSAVGCMLLCRTDRCIQKEFFPRSLLRRPQPLSVSVIHRIQERRRLNKTTRYAGQIAEAPLVFEVSKPVFEPLQTAAIEVILTLISAYVSVRLIRFVTRKYTEVQQNIKKAVYDILGNVGCRISTR